MPRDDTAGNRYPAVVVGLVLVSAVTTSWLVGTAVASVSESRMAPWILGRAAGVTSYLLLVALVLFGLVLSHPSRARWRTPSAATRIRVHVSLSVFTLAFTVLHIVVLATDRYAGVGWWGAVVPLGASYRPVPVTLGVIALYAGIAAGVTASLAGRLAHRVWWPVHKVAIVSLVLVWLHGVLAGADSAALLGMYVITAVAVVTLAISRYTTPTTRDRVGELEAASAAELRVSTAATRTPTPRRTMRSDA